jgi:diguanylate cyclase (GGDEF)-like protein
MTHFQNSSQETLVDFPDIVANMTSVGIMAVDRRFTVILWNRFMELHSNLRAETVLGKSLFDIFPELNRNWLEKKIKSCMLLKNTSFTSWRQRPYFVHFRAPTSYPSELGFMYQDSSIFPIRDRQGQVLGACIAIHDMTEVAETTRLLEQATDQAVIFEESSQRDGLTGMYNRKFFDEQITQEIGRSRRHGWPLGLAMLDIDHFKAVNDTYGHDSGDAVLRAVSARLQGMLRASDTFCRYGGEEFALILPHITLDNAQGLMERLRKAVEAIGVELEDGREVKVTISVGIAQLSSGQTPGELIKLADQALYSAKQAGRNRVICQR